MPRRTQTSGPTASSGNVFEDLGFSPEEAALLQLKTELKIAIEQRATRLKLTPKKLGQVLDVQQSQVSDLLTGKVSKMSIDKLAKYAHRLGMSVEVRAKVSKNNPDAARVA